MKMLSVCSTAPTSSSQISFHGRSFCLFPKSFSFGVGCILEDRIVFRPSNEIHLRGLSLKAQAAKSLHSSFVKSVVRSSSMDGIKLSSRRNAVDDLHGSFSHRWVSSPQTVDNAYSMRKGDLKYVQEKLTGFSDSLLPDNTVLSGTSSSEPVSVMDASSDATVASSGSGDFGNDSLSSVKTSIEDLFSRLNDSIQSLGNKGENAVNSSVESITSSIKSIVKGASEAVDNAATDVFSTVDQTGEVAGNKLENLSSKLKEASSKAGVIAIDQLRRIIVLVEESLTSGANVVLYYYGSAKELLPPDIQNLLNTSETETEKNLRPVGAVLQQIYTTIEGLEKSFGLDPSDPIVPFVLFAGTSVTLWVFYWRLTYGGYAGNLSPKSTLELLKGKEKTVLIDVRPEELRERDGIPDLRRAARSRYESVTLPEVDGSIQKLLKSGKDIDNALIAVVIRSLKIVQDRPKVVVMDADGTHSKGIARSLRKLGVKKPYIVEGGFQSWVKEGLRIKELKPETTLTILNEEAEAIFEDIRPNSVQTLGFGVGSLAAVYALLEWEKTLQLIGLVGLIQTIYWRVSSYEDAEAFKKDLRMLLVPVDFGTQAFSWAAGKLESNGIGIPTSPSPTLDVQNRVLQAAAKHESQSSNPEEIQDTFFESTATAGAGEDTDDISPEA